jgi:hypothetical protein
VTRRDKKLAARALECITQMALSGTHTFITFLPFRLLTTASMTCAVGPAPCNKYAKEVVDILRSSTPFAQQLRTESSTFVSAAIGRIALCMKLDFLPYLADFFSHLERAVRTARPHTPHTHSQCIGADCVWERAHYGPADVHGIDAGRLGLAQAQ